MKTERWERVKSLLDEALPLDAEHRRNYLHDVCLGDDDLRLEVESLLLSHEQAGNEFLKTPAFEIHANPVTHVGKRIGPYDILEEVGHGGMGKVYRAVRADGQYTKEVAIKLVRGGFDSASLLERFRNERQILASLDHPNIARLLDGGTTDDGIPYLVMELVEGVPIDNYCDEQRLNISQRLELFRHVCAAVQYAHQRLVIHRDIKPGNILVTADGTPKLLDFGIAKLLDPSVNPTTTVAHPMTPEYASPEQILGESVTTAADVYSLGIVLYQLLTGRSPYVGDTRLPHELARAICESQPERPSSVILKPEMFPPQNTGHVSAMAAGPEGSIARLRRRLHGDLDHIALKALRKEPQQRYGSAEQFAEDIRRHLVGLPVMARKGSWNYHAAKFIQRHRAAMAVTVAMVAMLIAGVILIVREARIASINAQRAEKRFDDVRKLANSLIFELHDSIRDLPGSTPARKLLVSRALEYLDSLAQQSKGDVSLQSELATAYERVGDVLGYPYAANLGDTAGALQSYRKALAIRLSLQAAQPDNIKLQTELVENYFRIANASETAGNFTEALEMVSKALPIAQSLGAGKQDSALADRLAGGYYYMAGLLEQTGDPGGALKNYREAASIRQEALQHDPTNMFLNAHLAADYAGMAHSMQRQRDLVHAIEMQNKAVETLEQISRAYPNNATLREYLAEALTRLAGFRQDHGDPSAGLEGYRRAHGMFVQLLSADPNNSLAKSNFGFSNAGIARSLIALGKPAAAVDLYKESVATFESMSPNASGNRYIRTGLATSYSGLGDAYSALAARPNTPPNRAGELWHTARAWYEKSASIWTDKEKRGELEHDEQNESRSVLEAIAKCDSALHGAGVH
jgi:non-specific serine/threonine protein kinase/serine/threonine-protein kinase